MQGNCFWDTNILVYEIIESLSNDEIKKQLIVDSLTEKLITSNSKIIISNQVIGEFINVLIRKYRFEEEIINNHVNNILNNFELVLLDSNDYQFALKLCYKYKISFYDSLIIAKALNSNCNILYSEDLNHDQIFENTLRVINPFKQ